MSLFSRPLSSVIDRFITGTYTVTRAAQETYDAAGNKVDGSETTFNIDAAIQPVTGRDLAQLPEGQRADETRLVLTKTELRTRLPGNAPDVITVGGETWTVFRVQRWDFEGSTHYQAWITRDVQTP